MIVVKVIKVIIIITIITIIMIIIVYKLPAPFHRFLVQKDQSNC